MAYGNGGSYGEVSSTAMQPQPSRMPMMESQLDRLVSGTETLHKALDELTARLTGVLTPEPPAVAEASGKPDMPVPPARAIGSQADRVSEACARIGRVISRLEL